MEVQWSGQERRVFLHRTHHPSIWELPFPWAHSLELSGTSRVLNPVVHAKNSVNIPPESQLNDVISTTVHTVTEEKKSYKAGESPSASLFHIHTPQPLLDFDVCFCYSSLWPRSKIIYPCQAPNVTTERAVKIGTMLSLAEATES